VGAGLLFYAGGCLPFFFFDDLASIAKIAGSISSSAEMFTSALVSSLF